MEHRIINSFYQYPSPSGSGTGRVTGTQEVETLSPAVFYLFQLGSTWISKSHFLLLSLKWGAWIRGYGGFADLHVLKAIDHPLHRASSLPQLVGAIISSLLQLKLRLRQKAGVQPPASDVCTTLTVSVFRHSLSWWATYTWIGCSHGFWATVKVMKSRPVLTVHPSLFYLIPPKLPLLGNLPHPNPSSSSHSPFFKSVAFPSSVLGKLHLASHLLLKPAAGIRYHLVVSRALSPLPVPSDFRMRSSGSSDSRLP